MNSKLCAAIKSVESISVMLDEAYHTPLYKLPALLDRVAKKADAALRDLTLILDDG